MESFITKLHLTLVFQNTEDIFIEYDYLTIRCKKKTQPARPDRNPELKQITTKDRQLLGTYFKMSREK